MSNSRCLPRVQYHGCPICNSVDFVEYAVADCTKHSMYIEELPPSIDWMECRSCSHSFTSGYYSDEQTSALFKRVHPNQSPGHDVERGRAVSSRIVERVSDYVASGTWLDVGFGDGSLLMTAGEFGFDPVGLDLRASSVEKMKSFGMNAVQKDLLEYAPTAPVSVLAMADVLEHTPFPMRILAKAADLLADGGAMFVSCPNREAPAWSILGASNPYWIEVEHFHNFGRRQLCELISKVGLRPVHYGISERYRLGMEIIAIKPSRAAA